MFERIMVPLDGSALAERILAKVQAFFDPRQTEFNLLLVVDMQGRIVDDKVPVTCSGHRAKQYLSAVAGKLSQQGARVSTDVRFGEAAAKILEHARERRSDLIAMSTHGRSGVDRIVRGSVAEAVLRGADLPVFLARGESAAPPKREPAAAGTRILVPLDGSAGSEAILPYVRSLARGGRAHVSVVRIAEWFPPLARSADGEAPTQPWTLRAETYIRQVCDQLRADGLDVEGIVDHGAPADKILERVRTGTVDLVAMSTHGYSGVKRLVFGSVAEEVLRNLRIPLLAVREAIPVPAEQAPPGTTGP